MYNIMHVAVTKSSYTEESIKCTVSPEHLNYNRQITTQVLTLMLYKNLMCV